MTPALQIRLRPSVFLIGALGLLHGLALAAAWISLSGWPARLIAAGILLSAAGRIAEALQRTAQAAMELEMHAGGRAAWRDRLGSWHDCSLGTGHFVSPLLIIVDLQQPNRRHKRILLLPDSAPAEDLRRLRVWLRWRNGSGDDARTA